MPRALPALVAALLLAGAADARAGDYRPGEVLVRGQVRGTGGATVPQAIAALARRGVRAVPNYIARVSYVPDDPGRQTTPGGWQSVQWNFLDSVAGVNAPGAWDNLIAAGRPGGAGVVVAVVDTGVAYRDLGRFRRSPDLTGTFAPGYDFVEGDRIPLDENGHGTHVASTIAETTGNGVYLTGLAYGATIMPVRVLDSKGEGDAADIARGIRFAADHGAQVINLSFEFPRQVQARQIPDILGAVRHAQAKGALVVAAAGNSRADRVAYPARADNVMSVGAITEHGCLARYSNRGATLSISAPGGGVDASLKSDPNCRPSGAPGRDVYQLTLTNSVQRFGLPNGYEGTSMAAPHVSATAALVIASGVLGPNPTPDAVAQRIEDTADDLGAPGWDPRYGAGKVDAAAATSSAR